MLHSTCLSTLPFPRLYRLIRFTRPFLFDFLSYYSIIFQVETNILRFSWLKYTLWIVRGQSHMLTTILQKGLKVETSKSMYFCARYTEKLSRKVDVEEPQNNIYQYIKPKKSLLRRNLFLKIFGASLLFLVILIIAISIVLSEQLFEKENPSGIFLNLYRPYLQICILPRTLS